MGARRTMTVQVTNPYYRTAYALVFKQGWTGGRGHAGLIHASRATGPRLAYRIAMGVRYAN
jgi:hypothetical protein